MPCSKLLSSSHGIRVSTQHGIRVTVPLSPWNGFNVSAHDSRHIGVELARSLIFQAPGQKPGAFLWAGHPEPCEGPKPARPHEPPIRLNAKVAENAELRLRASGAWNEKSNRPHGPRLPFSHFPVKFVQPLRGEGTLLPRKASHFPPALKGRDHRRILVVLPGQFLRADKLLHHTRELIRIFTAASFPATIDAQLVESTDEVLTENLLLSCRDPAPPPA